MLDNSKCKVYNKGTKLRKGQCPKELKMEIIKPTKKQVFDELRNGGCCWLGGQGCECKSRQLCNCYKEAETRLTKTEYTAEEIEENKRQNAKAMQEIEEALKIFE